MLPSLLARDIQTGLTQFLVSGFEPADAFMYGLMSRFADDEGAWLKGPFVQVVPPFVHGSAVCTSPASSELTTTIQGVKI